MSKCVCVCSLSGQRLAGHPVCQRPGAGWRRHVGGHWGVLPDAAWKHRPHGAGEDPSLDPLSRMLLFVPFSVITTRWHCWSVSLAHFLVLCFTQPSLIFLMCWVSWQGNVSDGEFGWVCKLSNDCQTVHVNLIRSEISFFLHGGVWWKIKGRSWKLFRLWGFFKIKITPAINVH